MGSASCVVTMRGSYLEKMLHWLRAHFRFWRSHPSRQLYLRETLTLGERRFIAVVEFERQKFLIAGTGTSVAMLTALPSPGNAKNNAEPEIAQEQEEVPTWGFTSEGPASQLIRR
jgi:flagellar biogenesis protein FliO